MLDVLAETSQDEEGDSPEDEEEAADREEVRNSGSPKSKWVPKEGRTRYYDRQQQLELVLAAQELLECGGHEVGDARSGDEETCAEDSSKTDIWEDEICLGLLKLIFRQVREQEREQQTITGRTKGSTLRDCMCPSLRKGWSL
jgi:hypothetical protein